MTRPLHPRGTPHSRAFAPVSVLLAMTLAVTLAAASFPPALTEVANPLGKRSEPFGPCPAEEKRVQAARFKLPFSFEANRGQTDRRVQFLSRGPGYTLFLTPTEAVLSLPSSFPTPPLSHSPTPPTRRSSVLRMRLLGADPEARGAGAEKLPGVVSYFRGSDARRWRTNIPTYGRVRYRNVYPGVDLVYYGNQGQLEYDFVVQPGADARAITLDFQGAKGLRVDKKGDLLLQVAGAEVRQRKPVCYQEIEGQRREVPGGYLLKAEDGRMKDEGRTPTRVAFRLGAYDPSRPLVIDPVLAYSTFLGGATGDGGEDITVDAEGCVYVTGGTRSPDFPATGGALQSTETNDVFVSKLDATGSTLLYSTFLGGSHHDRGVGIGVDAEGCAYVTGWTTLAAYPTPVVEFPTTPGAFDTSRNGSYDPFVAKLDPTGSALLYSTFLGGSQYDFAREIAVDMEGCAYVAGETGSSDLPTTNGAFDPTSNGGADAFVTKLDPTGSSLRYSTFLGGGASDGAQGITVDAAGCAYVTGKTDSQEFPTTSGAYSVSLRTVSDAFVTKLDPTGSSLYYSTYLGGSAIDEGCSIALDAAGSAYITGLTHSSDWPTTPGAFDPTSNGYTEAFVAKLDATGSALRYSTYLGGSSADWGTTIAVDAAGYAWVTGTTDSPNFPTTPAAYDATYGGLEVFATQLNPAGSSLRYSTFLGGIGNDYGEGIAVDEAGSTYLTGATFSPDFPTTPGAFDLSHGGDTDGFVAKLLNRPPGITSPAPVTAECTSAFGATVTLTTQVTDPDGDPLTVTWNVDGGTAERVDTVPAGGPPTSRNVSFTFTYLRGAHSVTITVSDGTRSASCVTTVTAVPPPSTRGADARGNGLVVVREGKATFDFQAVEKSEQQGWLSYQVAGRILRGTAIFAVVITGRQARIFGTGILNDSRPVEFVVEAVDNGTPGAGIDGFRIQMSDAYEAFGTLRSGEIQVTVIR